MSYQAYINFEETSDSAEFIKPWKKFCQANHIAGLKSKHGCGCSAILRDKTGKDTK